MASKKPRRTTGQDRAETPVLLPHVIVTVAENGALDVTVDGTPFPPPQQGAAWTRSTFGELMDAITADRTIAVRIEVREVDGSVFTDLIRARKPTPAEPAETKPQEQRDKHTKTKQGPELVEVTGEGFVPGEDIAVAVVVAHTDATGTGHARALIDTDRLAPVLAGGAGEVVLLGRVSGTLHIRRFSR
ncbi:MULTISPECIES: hypothetical protein [Micrococcales]|uniref:Uncharacterized protein n=1 Tax=Sediminivirga luteola TaxID=1774748 RepID=A0A8J2TYF8_9MICO|nr:hypothetical protein [Sediminivirga luteola]MCC5781998.1 hypothetical protein [Kocuria sp. CCUG 69068]GGA16196.1 hypothetical protein GCM10011333_19060 [Sediminivirga luteola]